MRIFMRISMVWMAALALLASEAGLAAAQVGSRPRNGGSRPAGGYSGPTGTANPHDSRPNPGPVEPQPDPNPAPTPGGAGEPPRTGLPSGGSTGITPVPRHGSVGFPVPIPVGPGPQPPENPPGVRPGREKPKPGSTNPLDLPFPVDRWENWWVFNQDRYLDVDRRYSSRARVAEPSRDEFLGPELVSEPALPVAFERRRLRVTVLPVLTDFSYHPSSLVRGEAALSLGRVGGRGAVPRLEALSRDKVRFVRQMALLGLGMTKDRAALRPLLSFLLDRRQADADRAHAALALALLGERDSLPALLAVTREEGREHNITGAALYAMGFLPGEDSALLLQEVVSDRTERSAIRGVATLALARLGVSGTVEQLVGLLHDSETHVRRSAALGLGGQSFVSPLWERREDLLRRLKEWTAAESLSPAARREFEDHLADVEREAVKETQALQASELRAVKALAKAMEKDSDVMVRAFATIALGRIASPEARMVLAEQLRRGSSSHSLRGFLALSLGIAESREAAGLLRRMAALERTDPSTRGAVATALGLIGDTPSGPMLMELALTHTNVVRGYAAVACGLMNHEDAREPFRRELLDEAQAFMRPTFGLALGLMGDHQSIDFLRRLIADTGAGLPRIQAAQALGRIRDVGSAEVLLGALKGQEPTDQELAQFLRALGDVGEKGSLPVMEPLARSWNYLLDFPVLNTALLR